MDLGTNSPENEKNQKNQKKSVSERCCSLSFKLQAQFVEVKSSLWVVDFDNGPQTNGKRHSPNLQNVNQNYTNSDCRCVVPR